MQRLDDPHDPRKDFTQLAGTWPLAGRDDVLKQVRDVVFGPGARSAVLAGEVGVGKSRLAHEVALQVETGEFATARVAGKLASAGIPLGAFAPVLPAIGQGETGVVDDRADLLRRCAEALRSQTGGRRLLLLVDDAHLLDDVSATLVYQLAGMPWVIVLATVRARELAPDPVVALWKEGLAERIELEGLSPEGVSAALDMALGGLVDDATVATLGRRAKGNMLFLRELVLGAVADGTLSNEAGVWRLLGDLHPTARLVELVESRLAGLSEDERSVMELISFGEPLALEDLEVLADPSVAEGLERKGLLRSSLEQHTVLVALAHPLYGEVIRAQTPAIRTRSIVRSLADAVERAGVETPDDLIRVANWRLMSGSVPPELMFRAAVAARWRFDFPLAERLVCAGIEAGAGFEAELLSAQLTSLQGRSGEAAAALAELAERAQGWRQRGLVALSRLDNRIIYAGTIDEGLQMAEEAVQSLAGTPMADEIAARRLALVLAHEGPRRAVELAQPLLERTTGRALVWACMPAAYSLGRAGRIDEALEASRRGYQTQIGLTEPMDWYPFMHRFYEAEALAHAGRFAEAESLASWQYQEAVANESVEAQGLFSWQLTKGVADRGHVDEAIRHSSMAVAIYRQLDRPAFLQFSLIYQVLALSVGHRAEEAREALALYDSLPLSSNYFMGVDLAHARAWLDIAEGNIRRACEALLVAAEEGVRIGDMVGATACLHSVARVGHAKEAAAQLTELSAHMQGDLAPARARHARALVDGRPDELETVAESFESMGATLLAAEAATDAAVAWRQHGQLRRSAVAERRAAWLSSQCRGAATPALQVAETRARLTAAEWEAVQLAAAGRSNKAIAEELVISVRTVENRLQHAYGKLGVSSRSELPAVLETLQRPG